MFQRYFAASSILRYVKSPLILGIGLFLLLPAVLAWGHFWNWLSSQQCILVMGYPPSHGDYNYDTPGAAVLERYCRTSNTLDTSVLVQQQQYNAMKIRTLPTVVELSDFLAGTSKTTITDGLAVVAQWDGTGWKIVNEETTPVQGASIIVPPLLRRPSAVLNFAPPFHEPTPATTTTVNSSNRPQTAQDPMTYGFRRNPQKQKHIDASNHQSAGPFIPVTTVIFLFVNIIIYLWLNGWCGRTTHRNTNTNSPISSADPSRVVVLNGQVYHDFGRSVTGHLSHFEVWHIGFNMMTLSSLGPSLEAHYGSLSMLLWTLSFLPLTTLVVMGLFQLSRRSRWYQQQSVPSSSRSSTFPSMVGFSGILFIWMVVSTLNGQQSCPIIFLPNLCFDTWSLDLFGTTIRISGGPLVQLIVLQAILPRVSFFGHLAGIVVGFLWQWLPFLSLEWLQPSVLYPVLWISCKFYYCSYYCYSAGGATSTYGETTTTTTTTGSALGNHSNMNHRRWGNSTASNDGSISATLQRLAMLRNILVAHCIWHSQEFGVFSSGTISEMLLLAILCVLVKIGRQQQQHKQPSLEQGHDVHPLGKELLGIVGRGYICLALVSMVTDGLTLGGWLVTWNLWSTSSITRSLVLLLFRNGIHLLSMALTVHALVLVYDTGASSPLSSSGGGGTFSLFVWPLVSQFQPIGKWLQEQCGGCSRWHKVDNVLDTSQQQQKLQRPFCSLPGFDRSFGGGVMLPFYRTMVSQPPTEAGDRMQEGGDDNSAHRPGKWLGNRCNETIELV